MQGAGRQVAPGAHAVLVLDGAGYHIAHGLVLPDNISLLKPPPYAPERNPVQNIWQYLRQNKRANRLRRRKHLIDACCKAWNFFADDKPTAPAITTRPWATVND